MAGSSTVPQPLHLFSSIYMIFLIISVLIPFLQKSEKQSHLGIFKALLLRLFHMICFLQMTDQKR